MGDNMSEMMEKLNGMLKGKEIPDNIKDMLGSVMNGQSNSTSDTNTNSSNNSSSTDNIDINTILKMQQIIKAMNSEKSNSSVNLLRSLKPYLKQSRQDKVEQYIQLFNMEKVIELMNHTGGDKK